MTSRLRSTVTRAGIGALAVLCLSTLPTSASLAQDAAPDDRHLTAGSVTELAVGGGSSVPADASAVALNVTATNATMPGYVSLYPCGQPVPEVSNLNYVPGQTVANAAIVPLGAGGKVCIYTLSPVNVVVDLAGWYAPGAFGAVAPARLLDARATNARLDDSVVTVPVAGVAGVAANATAVAVNITVTNSEGDGFATAFPCGGEKPTVSNVNHRGGQTVAGAAVVPVGVNGSICVYSYAPADVIVDVYGSLGPTGLTSAAPTRVADTRDATALPAGGTLPVTVAGAPGTSAALAVTAVPTGQAGYLTVYPCDGPRPSTSNVNYGTSRPVANLALSLVGSDRTVCVFTSHAADVIVDWFGTLPADGGFSGMTPVRLYDSRSVTADVPFPADAPPPPANSGAGRRIVYANAAQRAWLIEDDGSVTRTYLVSGKAGVPSPGKYAVYSKSRFACSVTCTAHMEYMVRFAVSARGNGIGFHAIPYQNGVPMQNEDALGEFRSSGCVRQAPADAIFLWNWAGVGTPVIVTA